MITRSVFVCSLMAGSVSGLVGVTVSFRLRIPSGGRFPKTKEPPGPVGAGGSGERVCGAFALGQKQEVENGSHREPV